MVGAGNGGPPPSVLRSGLAPYMFAIRLPQFPLDWINVDGPGSPDPGRRVNRWQEELVGW